MTPTVRAAGFLPREEQRVDQAERRRWPVEIGMDVEKQLRSSLWSQIPPLSYSTSLPVQVWRMPACLVPLYDSYCARTASKSEKVVGSGLPTAGRPARETRPSPRQVATLAVATHGGTERLRTVLLSMPTRREVRVRAGVAMAGNNARTEDMSGCGGQHAGLTRRTTSKRMGSNRGRVALPFRLSLLSGVLQRRLPTSPLLGATPPAVALLLLPRGYFRRYNENRPLEPHLAV